MNPRGMRHRTIGAMASDPSDPAGLARLHFLAMECNSELFPPTIPALLNCVYYLCIADTRGNIPRSQIQLN